MNIEINIENAILKILLTDSSKSSIIFELSEDIFYEDIINREIFKTAKILYNEGIDIDNVTIVQYTSIKGLNNRLTEILLETEAYSFRIKSYCKILFERFLNKLIKNALGKEDLKQIEIYKERYIFDDEIIKQIGDNVENFDEIYKKRKESMIITTWNKFDNYIGSFCGGDYIALGGSTGTGKTTIALNLAKNLCIQDKKVLYCSLEMPLEQLQNRFNCMITNLNAIKYRSCGFTKEEFEIYKNGLKTLNQWNLNVVCDYDLTVEKLQIYAQQQLKEKGLDFIIIDYLGLMSGYNNKSFYEKVTNISRKLKLLATKLCLPILVLVQLNRSNNNREDKRPILSDIRESGAIEQDADYVIFAYRDYIYNPESNPENLEFIIAKNRHGINNKIIKFNYNLKTQNISEKYLQ